MNNYHHKDPALNISRRETKCGYRHDLERMATLFALCKALRIKRNDPLIKDIWYKKSWYVTALTDKLTEICSRRGIVVC